MMQRTPSRAARSLALLFAAIFAGSALAQETPAAAAPAPSSDAAPVASTDASVDGALAAEIAAGGKLYLKNCRTCHGTKGTAGVPLAGNAKVQADYGYLVWAILTGPGYMPEFGPALSDEQIAGIATYILNSWGNDYGPVTPEDVRDQR